MIKCDDGDPGLVTLTPNDNSFLFQAVDVDEIIFAAEDNIFGIRRPEICFYKHFYDSKTTINNLDYETIVIKTGSWSRGLLYPHYH